MAGSDRIAPGPLASFQRLRQEPQRFNLFAALRLLELVDTGRPRIGEARRPADEWIRLEQPPHLTFAPSDVAAAEPVPGGRLRIGQYCFGAFGPNGALPFHLSEFAFQRRRHHEDSATSDFINLFQHRLITLFYRAWAESDPVAGYARPGDDDFAVYLGALSGLFGPPAFGRDSVADHAKLCRAGVLADGSRSADGLQALLSDYFGMKMVVHQFVGSWLRVPPDQRTRLGGSHESAVLGISATIGAASWQRNSRFEISVGPMPFEDFMQFLPGSRALRALRDLVRLYTTGEWSWQLRLLVSEGAAPGVALGQIGRLGWTSWLGRKQGVARDVVLSDETAMAA